MSGEDELRMSVKKVFLFVVTEKQARRDGCTRGMACRRRSPFVGQKTVRKAESLQCKQTSVSAIVSTVQT